MRFARGEGEGRDGGSGFNTENVSDSADRCGINEKTSLISPDSPKMTKINENTSSILLKPPEIGRNTQNRRSFFAYFARFLDISLNKRSNFLYSPECHVAKIPCRRYHAGATVPDKTFLAADEKMTLSSRAN